MSIYVKPIITEKFSAMADKGRYAFVVEKTANKVEIKQAIEKAYGVTVASVNTMNYIGKIKFRYTQTKIMTGLVKKAKKAVVTLKKGETIDFYGNI
ncbi:MAG: 50S ribosomal protein L23 [Bacteroidetes bacterium]|nr:MAG: 50S ribosomal protein L23 [Bacteroidota bacterium]